MNRSLTAAPGRASLAVRVEPTPRGSGDVQPILLMALHQCSGLSPLSSAHTVAASLGSGVENVYTKSLVLKSLSTSGSSLKDGMTITLSLV
ncbi:Uncharacterised protein [Mycobacteroides abscessus subsp. abscessus]|nr:Uncharacterised protein [Mycobacteroides abscessus subsp. abscessus]